jgi:hypothetical protein
MGADMSEKVSGEKDEAPLSLEATLGIRAVLPESRPLAAWLQPQEIVIKAHVLMMVIRENKIIQ